NVIYINPEEQNKIKGRTIFLGGVGLGSMIVETALRLGFEKFILVDGDEVEMSNLNRQNYRKEDIGRSKVEATRDYLLSINPDAKIDCHHLFLNPDNIEELLADTDIAINAIDFDVAETAFVFDEICQKLKIPVIHPLNLGWAGAAYLVTPDSEQFSDMARGEGRFELTLIKNIIDQHGTQSSKLDLSWFQDFVDAYKLHSDKITPPQLAVGSALASGIVTNLLFSLVNGVEPKTYPHIHFLSTR
ncbi:MAG: ThiF family adenylyltransferase, partial [Bacteroidota bacterium]